MKKNSILFLIGCVFLYGTGCPSQEVKQSKPESVSLDAGITQKKPVVVPEKVAVQETVAQEVVAKEVQVSSVKKEEVVAQPSEETSEVVSLYKQAKLQEAIVKAKQETQTKGSEPLSWYNLGVLQDATDFASGGAVSYKKALELQGDFYPAIANLALLHKRQGNSSEADALLKQKASQYPDNSHVQNLWVQRLIELKQFDQAEKRARALQKKNETDAEAIFNLGLIWYHQNKLELAQFAFQNASNILNEDSSKKKKKKTTKADYSLLAPKLYYYSALVSLKQDGENKISYQKALKEYLEKVIQHQPVYPEVLNLMGVLNTKLGKWEEGESKIRQAIRFQPRLWEAYINLGIVLTQSNKKEEAAQTLIQLLKQNPSYYVAHYQLGILYLEGELKTNYGAIESSMFLKEVPSDLKTNTRITKLVEQMVRWGSCAYHFSIYIKNTPSLPENEPVRGYLNTANKNTENLKKRLEKTIKRILKKQSKELKKTK